MASVKEHYDAHLAPLYSWMSGGSAGARERFAALLADLSISPSNPSATALDLGAGNGFQTIPLAQAGFVVTAVDLSEVLLAELVREVRGLPVKAVQADICELTLLRPTPAPEVIVCMGDTLTHLPRLDDVRHLLRDAAAALASKGYLLLSFRDYTTPREGVDRFIPVRSDENQILTCFLEFGPTHVSVHDLVHTRTTEGWQLRTSGYEKIRLSPAWVVDQIIAHGLTVLRHTTQNGLVTLVARR